MNGLGEPQDYIEAAKWYQRVLLIADTISLNVTLVSCIRTAKASRETLSWHTCGWT